MRHSEAKCDGHSVVFSTCFFELLTLATRNISRRQSEVRYRVSFILSRPVELSLEEAGA